MNAIEMVILMVFGVPIVGLCGMFVVLAGRMQAQDEQRLAAQHGK